MYIEQTIEAAFALGLQSYFANYQIAGGSFLIKGYGDATATPLHQDWNMVDETRHVNFSVWVPLQDVDHNSGCLHVLPGSHRWFGTLRGANMPSVYVSLPPPLWHTAPALRVAAGTAVVFAVNVFHASEPNLTGQPRPAVHLALTNKHAPLLHYVKLPDGSIAEVSCPREALYNFIFEVKKGHIPAGMHTLRILPSGTGQCPTEEQLLLYMQQNL